mgnify:CR=1 FL=1
MSKLSSFSTNWLGKSNHIDDKYQEKGVVDEVKPKTSSHPKRKQKRHTINVKNKRKMTKQSRRTNR